MCGGSEFISTILGLVASGVIGLATALYVERAKLPRLEIGIAPSSDQNIGGRNVRFLHISISHAGVAPFVRNFLQPSPALACTARLKFLREDGFDAMPAPFDARWTGSQQPSEFILQNGILFPSVFEILRRRDIYPRTEEKIDVCVKFEQEDDCYVFTNSSYVKSFSSPEYRLTKGVYFVDVIVACGDIMASRRFRLRNDFLRPDFRLEEV